MQAWVVWPCVTAVNGLLTRAVLPGLLLQMVSTMANSSIQEVASTSQHPCLLFQLYVIRDRALVQQWVQQAEAAGYKGLVITVDAQRLVRHMQDCMRATANNFSWAIELVWGHAAHMVALGLRSTVRMSKHQQLTAGVTCFAGAPRG